MSQSAEEIRAEIETTRRELGQDVDALADKVTPSKIVDRQKNKLRGALSSVKDRVMGAADDAATSVKDAGHSAGYGIKDAGYTVKNKAQGNPLAAGLIAFGAGLLVSALIPPSDKERELAAAAEEKAQPLVEGVKDAAREVGENLREPAREAVESVKGTAQDAAHHVADDAKSSGETVADETRRAASRAQSDMGSGVS
jgi:gas vesicle protein